MKRVVLALARRLRRPLEALGVEFEAFMLLLELKLELDLRRPLPMFQGQRRQQQRSSALPHLALLFQLLMGCMFAFIASVLPPLSGLALVHAFVMLMLAMALLADFNTVIHDPADDAVLRPRPLGERTILATRLFHAGAWVMLSAIALGLPAAILGPLRGHWWFVPIYLLSLVQCTLLTIALVYTVYLGVMRFVDARRFREIVNVMQIVMSIAFTASYMLLGRVGDLAEKHPVDIALRPGAGALPPVWMAALPASMLGAPLLAVPVLLGSVVPIAAIVVVFVVLAPAYRKSLNVVGSAGRKAIRTGRLATMRNVAGPERYAAYRLVSALLARDRSFRLRVYPGLAMLIVALGANQFLFQGANSLDNLRAGYHYLTLLYLALLVCVVPVAEFTRTESAACGWVLLAAPFERAGDVFAGALAAVLRRFALPALALASAITLVIWGPSRLADVVLAWSWCPVLLAASLLLVGTRLPFSHPVVQQSAYRPLAAMAAMIVVGLAGGVHFLIAYFLPWIRLPLAALALVLGWTLWRGVVRIPWSAVAPLLVVALVLPAATAGTPVQPRHHQVLELPGVPVSLVPADLDRDGTPDLVLAVAYTRWGSVTEDHLEGAIQALEVVPALFDRREIHAFLREPDGTYASAAPPLEIPLSVHALEAGPPGAPVVAATDDGVSVLRLRAGEQGNVLALERLIDSVPAFAGSSVFLPALDLVHDVDRDGTPDLLWPGRREFEVYRGTAEGFERAPATHVPVPGDVHWSGVGANRRYPLPVAVRADGGTLPDLLFRGVEPQLMNGRGAAAFDPAAPIELGCLDLDATRVLKGKKHDRTFRRALAFLGDLDGDGRLEAVTQIDLAETDKLKDAKDPRTRLRFHRLASARSFDPQPYLELETHGIPFGAGALDDALGQGFVDLDGDGRLDYVTVTLKFSALQIVRVMATKKMSVGLVFNAWHQEPDGTFRPVAGLALEDTLKLDLNDLELNRLAEFAGDFDGDGRLDFVHLGRGREVTIVRGQPGARYGTEPDFALELQEAPQDLGLLRVADLDGDGRADLAVIHVGAVVDQGATAPVRLELVTSRGAR